VTIILTTIGSRGVTVDVGPAALPEAAGGVAIEYGLHAGPLIFTLTQHEAAQLAAASPSSLRPGRSELPTSVATEPSAPSDLQTEARAAAAAVSALEHLRGPRALGLAHHRSVARARTLN
jgi:hypothetical protein